MVTKFRSSGRENTNIKSVSRIEEYNGEEEWLGCIPWTGKGSELPAGMITPVGITAKSLCRYAIILDPALDEGVKKIKVSSFDKKRHLLVDVELNEKSVAAVYRIGGINTIKFVTATGQILNRRTWKAKFRTDALKLQAIKELLR